MELTLLPKEFKTSDNKFLHHHFPDVLATVNTTQEIPKEAILGPCLLQDTQLDTVAFIALKCSERRNIHYVIEVDNTSVQNPGGFPWMKLIQAAASKTEQNLEASLKNSHLYYRAIRKIHRNEELLVWYDEELSRLLGFNEIKASRRLQGDLDCPNCKQIFKCEYSYLSHARFLCFSENSSQLWRNLSASKMVKSRLVEQATNFKSLAVDLEFKMATWKDYSHGGNGMNCDKMENNQGRKTVLLEKTNCLYKELYSENRDEEGMQYMLKEPFWEFSTGKQIVVKKDSEEQKESAFTEVRKMKLIIEKAKKVQQGNGEAYFGHQVYCSPGSAFSFVWPTRASGGPKSAFSKPAKGLMDATHRLSDLGKGSGKLSRCITVTDLMRYKSLLTSKYFVGDLSSSPLLQTSFIQSNTFPYSEGLWSRQTKDHVQTTSTSISNSSFASLTLLPPTFTSVGIADQNWCAKCNLTFRMTSDLVFHMRSYHKKESVFPQSNGKRRREEKLSCPVCQEYFQERHHLSRHMTSHN